MGRWPPKDCDGQPWADPTSCEARLANTPLADHLCGVLWAIKGDLEFFALSLNLRHFNAFHMCPLCPADRGEDRTLQYNNFDRDARWKEMLCSVDQFKATFTEKPMHPLFYLAGVNNHCIEPDELHLLHLGTNMYFLGNILHLFWYNAIQEEGAPSTNMTTLWGMISVFYSNNHDVCHCQFTNLTLSSLCNPDAPHTTDPKLKGKGAEIMDLSVQVGPDRRLHVPLGWQGLGSPCCCARYL